MNRFWVVLLLAVWSQIGCSQVIHLFPNPWNQSHHPFNEKYIERNGIQRIQVKISTKKEMDRIRNTHLVRVFEFDSSGHIVAEKSFKARTDTSATIPSDTLLWSYIYSPEGLLKGRKEYLGNGFIQKSYEYNHTGDLAYQKTEQVDAQNPKNSTIISIDSIVKVSSDPQIEVYRFFNDYGVPYKEMSFLSDSLGYLLQQSERFLRSKRTESISYFYNDYGLLDSLISLPKNNSEKINYDSYNRPASRFNYKSGMLAIRKEYLYREDGSLKAILSKDMGSNIITIWEIEYVKKD
jgi:hypothetical protein